MQNRYWHKTYTDHRDRVPRNKPLFTQSIHNTGGKGTPYGGKLAVSASGAGKTEIHAEKIKLDHLFTPRTKIN